MHRSWLVTLILIVVTLGLARFWMASPRVVPIRRIADVVPPPPRQRTRYSSRSAFDHPIALAMAYLVAIIVAELATVANQAIGLPVHAVFLFALLLHGASVRGARQRALLWGLALAPLIRLLSLSLPLVAIPVIYWYAVISVPIVASTVAAARALGYSWRDLGLGLRWRFVPLLVLMIPLGIGVGVMQYLLLQPRPLARTLDLQEVWLPAVILIVSTGFVEELVFRGLMQRAAVRLLGGWGGILYATAVFTALHASYLLLGSIGLVFATGLIFAALAWWTRSIVLPAVAHATINVTVFLVAPLALPRATIDALSTAAIEQQVAEWYGAVTAPRFPPGPNADEHALATPAPRIIQGGAEPAPTMLADVPSTVALASAALTVVPTTETTAAIRDASPSGTGLVPATVKAPAPAPTPAIVTIPDPAPVPATVAAPAPTPAAEAVPSNSAPDTGVAVAAAPAQSPPTQPEVSTGPTARVIERLLPAGIGQDATRAVIARIAREVGEIVVDGFRRPNDGWRVLSMYAAQAWTDQFRSAPETLDQDERRAYEENHDALLDTIVESDSPFRHYRESYIGALRRGVDVPRARELDAALRGYDGYTSPFPEPSP